MGQPKERLQLRETNACETYLVCDGLSAQHVQVEDDQGVKSTPGSNIKDAVIVGRNTQ